MKSRMSDAQRQDLKAKAAAQNSLNALARTALGDRATRVQQEKADKALTDAVGKRQAKKIKEQELRRAGARPKGLARFLGR